MDEPQVMVYAHGMRGEQGPPTAVITHKGLEFLLRFADGDIAGSGPLQGLEVRPGTEGLEPRALRQFAPDTERYLAYARAAMRLLGAKLDEQDPSADWDSRFGHIHDAAEALRTLGRPGRGLTEQFYKTIGLAYDALVAEGERHPVKTLGEIHHVRISTASRWITEARRRGHITQPGRKRKEAGDA